MGKKKKLKGKVQISNVGRGVLRLSAIEVFNQALTVKLPRREIPAGQSVDMTIQLDMSLLSRFKSKIVRNPSSVSQSNFSSCLW